MTSNFKTLLSLLPLLIFASCENDDPISQSQVQNVELTCTYSISPDMLRYFDYTLRYTDDDGYTAYTKIDRSVTELKFASTLPCEKLFKFVVTRTDMPAPTEPVVWHQTFEAEVIRNFNDGSTDTIKAANTEEYNIRPEDFEQWASQQYIPLMEQGHEVYVNYAGNVNFSFD